MSQELLQDLEAILANVREYAPNHHMGRPFLSAYQLAIQFEEQHRNHPLVLQYRVGGSGTGEYQSLAQYLARFLSQSIQEGRCPNIEGGFISHDNIECMVFAGDIEVSTLSTQAGHSIFRYVGPLLSK
jgi:hypothetical protein